MNWSFINIIDYLGTFAFAISGIRLASAKRFDWFGAYVVGLVTAIGGGTTRDLLLGITPFWMQQPSYLIVTGIALLFVILFGKYIIRLNNTFFIFDAIGLGLFVVVGIDKSLESGFSYWIAIIMGMISGSVGGIIRDILINEVPLIFRKDIYALACVNSQPVPMYTAGQDYSNTTGIVYSKLLSTMLEEILEENPEAVIDALRLEF